MTKEDSFSLHTLHVVTFAVTLLPSLLTIACFSQVSPFCPHVLKALVRVPQIFGVHVYAILFVVLCLYVFAIWQSNWTEWPASRRLVGCGFGFLLAYGTAWLAVPYQPCLALASLGLSGMAALYAIRKTIFPSMSSDGALYQVGVIKGRDWYYVASVSMFLASSICLLTWVIWLAFIGFDRRESWTDWTGEIRTLVSDRTITWKMAFVSWIAPFALSFQQALLGALIHMRKRHAILADKDPTDESTKEKLAFISHSIQQLVVVVAAAVMTSWITASINATGDVEFNQEREDMRDEVLALAFWSCVGLAVALAQLMDWEAVEEFIVNHPGVKDAEEVLASDWVRALFLLSCALPMSVLICIHKLKAFCRFRTVHPLAFTQGSGDHVGRVVRTGTARWLGYSPWDWTSIVVKALWLGVVYVALQVGCMKAITVFLAFVNERLSVWPIWTVSALMFCIAWFIFMLPPAPGPPVYMLMGIVIISSALNAGWSFLSAVLWATFVAFAMKMLFTASAMHLVGRPFRGNFTVRRWIGINTPYMRAVELLLGGGKEGQGNKHFSLAKVSLLVGGPDWPVAVLCGILNIDTSLVLLCVSPVLLQSVFPCVLAGGLMLHRGPESERHMGGLAELCLLFMAGLQLVAFLIAGYYIQEVLERRHAQVLQLLENDFSPDERNAEKRAMEEEQSFLVRTHWSNLTWYVKATLVGGLVLMEASFIIFLMPWRKLGHRGCFKDIALTTSVEQDLGGNPLNVVNPLGWGGLVIFALATACLAIFYAWAAYTAPKSHESETLSASPAAPLGLQPRLAPAPTHSSPLMLTHQVQYSTTYPLSAQRDGQGQRGAGFV